MLVFLYCLHAKAIKVSLYSVLNFSVKQKHFPDGFAAQNICPVFAAWYQSDANFITRTASQSCYASFKPAP